jgi:hypothetical protein
MGAELSKFMRSLPVQTWPKDKEYLVVKDNKYFTQDSLNNARKYIKVLEADDVLVKKYILEKDDSIIIPDDMKDNTTLFTRVYNYCHSYFCNNAYNAYENTYNHKYLDVRKTNMNIEKTILKWIDKYNDDKYECMTITK